jgi:hypothetical protein
MTLKEEALQAAYESMVDRLPPMSYETFLEKVEGWEVHPVEVQNKLVGALLIQGPEVHACIKPEGFKKWFNKSRLRVVDNLIKEYGFALTRVIVGNKVGIEFVERLGFHENNRWDNTIIYIKD